MLQDIALLGFALSLQVTGDDRAHLSHGSLVLPG